MLFSNLFEAAQRRGAAPDAGHAQLNAANTASLASASKEVRVDQLVALAYALRSDEREVTELLKRTLGEDYRAEIDTIILPGAEHKAGKIGRYTVMVSPHVNEPAAYAAGEVLRGLRY